MEGLIESKGNPWIALTSASKEYIMKTVEYNADESNTFVISIYNDIISQFQKANLAYRQAIEKAEPGARVLYVHPFVPF